MGTAVNVFAQAVEKIQIPPDEICLLSTGIGCTGKVKQYLDIQTHETTDKHFIDRSKKLMSENPRLKLVLFLDDADFIVSGVELFVQAGVKGADVCIIYLNNYLHRIFKEHKVSKSIQGEAGNLEKRFGSPFNIPHLAKFCGAWNVARWTPHHPHRLSDSLINALQRPGYSVVEVISPCLLYYNNIGMIGRPIDRKKMYEEQSVIKNGEPTENLDLRAQEKIIIGDFICRED